MDTQTLRAKVLLNKRNRQLSITLSKRKLKGKLKGKIPKYVKLKLGGFEF